MLKKQFLPFVSDTIYKLLIFFISIVGLYYIVNRIWNLNLRDNMDYDKFNWGWNGKNSKDIPYVVDNEHDNDSKCLGDVNMKDYVRKELGYDKSCEGAECCDIDTGMTFDNKTNKCIQGFQNKHTNVLSNDEIFPWDGLGQVNPNDDNFLNYSPI